MKILIGYDGSDSAEALFEDLERAGIPAQAEVLVLSVADVWLPPEAPESHQIWPPALLEQAHPLPRTASAQALRAVEEARSLAELLGERLRALFPSWKVCAEALGDSPAWALIKRADSWKPDLILVGSHGRSAIGRFILGSVSQKVLNEACCSVRIARRLTRGVHSPIGMVIGVDGSTEAEAAVGAVAGRFWPGGSEARVVAALDPAIVTAIGGDGWGWARNLVEAAERELRAAGLAASSVVREGDPKRLLIEEAEQWGADSIFLGARGLRRIERMLLGSVSAAVAARAHCSVEVVRAGAGRSGKTSLLERE